MKRCLLQIYYKILAIKDYNSILFNKVILSILKSPMVHSTDETLNEIVNGKCSVSRYGDGEFALMNGKGLLFQPYCAELSLRLREIIVSEQEKHMVCIPNVFKSLEWCEEKPKSYWDKYLNLHRHKIYKMIDMKKKYYDALVTRLYIDHKDKSAAEIRFAKLKKLWNKREVVTVEGEQTRLGIGNDLFRNASSIKRILCPATDAFSKYDEILEEVKKQDKSKLILISLGPTATVLAYDLSINGFQAIDIGHVDIEYEWFLQKAVEKCPINNKYIGEVPNGTEVTEIHDMKYESEIVMKIV
ncbi:glycosyl transferase family 8 [Bacillus canaveralius]|uniref:Glycosyl transferase family 8 n=1 Tax=Bacillus canaveralius TaxID=1403243 RepID=A0A2N5GNH7_9BACI|nr:MULTISPECIES: SP_1767 family glycosyltransferase [Bacillus]PLR84030.1 glycosyl transferase family 8 [Bacillus canaveralius]PLR87262.1 glycosyl transferase family 8 [Bacillus sp. V33-4]PLR96325.1 glycosyl transferase family 8 [Bacillus canaveralius]